MKTLTQLFRFTVGFIFILSGLIKMNDPVGFSFKLEEYFGADVLNLEFMIPLALFLAVTLVIAEVLLGVMLLLGYKVKFTLWSLLLMIVFFTFLTFYSAWFNKVTDCGCFGDAIKLTPWESFTKDVVLLVLILGLFLGKRHIKPIFSRLGNGVLTLVTLVACGWFSYYVIQHLPVVDFRPYKIGANIPEGMSIPEDAPKPVYEYAWKFKVDGKEEIVITNGDYPEVDGEFLTVETREIEAGYEPPIHDFSMEKEGEDHTGTLMEESKLLLIVARDIAKTEQAAFAELNGLLPKAKAEGYRVVGLSASSQASVAEFLEKVGMDIDFYFCDLTTLKTIVRSNPGVLTLEKGTITGKVHFNDLDGLGL